jgi:hypothetical protein
MFYTLLNLSPLWKDSSENKRRSRIMILGTSFYILAYSYLQSSMVSNSEYALMLKNYIKYIIGLDILLMMGLQMKNAYDKPPVELNPHMSIQDDALMQQHFQNQQMHGSPQQLPIQTIPQYVQQLHQQNQPMLPLPMAQPQMPRPQMPRPPVQMQPSLPVQLQPSPPVQMQPSPQVQMQPSPQVQMQPSSLVQMQPSPPIHEQNPQEPEPEFEIPVYNKSNNL